MLKTVVTVLNSLYKSIQEVLLLFLGLLSLSAAVCSGISSGVCDWM